MATTNPLRPNDVVLGTPATRPSSGSRGGAPAGQGWNQQPRPDTTPGPDDVLQNPNARPPRAAGGGGSGGWGRRANTSPAAPAATPAAPAAAPPSAAAAPRTAPAAAPATAANSPTSPSNSMGFSDYMSAARSIGQDAQASATTGAFDESKGAAGRVASITDAGGSLMTSARTRAKARMARSGMMNSSLAGQAGEQAVIDAATPLAQTDAQLYAQQQIENQRAQNQASLANASIRAQTGIAGMQMGENARQFDSRLGFDQGRASEDDKYRDKQLSQQDRQFLQDLDLQRDKLKTDSEQFAQRLGLDVRQLDQQDAQFKANLSQEDRQFLDNLNLKRDELNQQQGQFDARLGFDNKQLDQQGQQFAADLQIKRDALDQEQSQFEARLGMDEKQLELNRDQLSQQDRQFMDDLKLRKDAQTQQESQFVRDQQNRITLANLDASNREKLMGIEAEYKEQIAGSENISRAWGSMMDSISQINNNPELDQAAKNTMIENAQNGFRAFTNFWNKASGGSTDVSDLLAFGPAGSTYTPPNDPNPPNVGIPEDEEADFNAGYYGGGGHGDR